jgi:hypothetical protein
VRPINVLEVSIREASNSPFFAAVSSVSTHVVETAHGVAPEYDCALHTRLRMLRSLVCAPGVHGSSV